MGMESNNKLAFLNTAVTRDPDLTTGIIFYTGSQHTDE